ncbi:phosphodiester glycosidase family protein [bacterium]|nr:phosphodiester glycosidase family protein [bacterium]
MRHLRTLLLTLALGLAGAQAASAETWKTVASDTGVQFKVNLKNPRIVRKVPLVDGMRWDIEVSNSVKNHVVKQLASGPLASVTIDQNKRYVRIVARWRFPYVMTPKVSHDRFELFIPYTITRTSTVDLSEGLTFQRMNRWTMAGPVSVNVVNADLKHYALRPQLARPGQGFSVEPVSAIANRSKALAAINGSFFAPKGGAPIGLLMLDGQIVSSSYFNRSVFGVRYDGTCFINNAKLKAAIGLGDNRVFVPNGVNREATRNQLILYTSHWGNRTRTYPDPSRREFMIAADGTVLAANTGNSEIPRGGYVVSGQGTALKALVEQFRIGKRVAVYAQLSDEWQGVRSAIGGGPTLVSGGQVKVTAREERFGPEIARGRAPRTAIAYLGGTSIAMVTVDGRQKHSVGMTLYELARLLRELGAHDAINLDGGGSTAMVVRGKLVNHPSDGVERSVNNALIVTRP